LIQKLSNNNAPEDKCKGALQLLETFGEQPEWKRAETGEQQVFHILREFLRILNRKCLGKQRTADMNMCFVRYLTNLPSRTAYWALLEVLKDDDCIIMKLQSLVIKCLKKVEKGRQQAGKGAEGCVQKAESEARSVMEVVLTSRHSGPKLTVQSRRQAWLDGAKEVVEIARRWMPEVVDECFLVTLDSAAESEDRRLLEELCGKSSKPNRAGEESSSTQSNIGGESCSKENVPVTAPDAISKQSEEKAPSPMATRNKTPSSPCTMRNEQLVISPAWR